MSEDRDRTPDPGGVPAEADKPADLSDAEWAAIQQARAEVAAGRYYTQEEVERWLRTWGTDHETDGPEQRAEGDP
jgi:predicted transcriptional regulator